MSHSIVSLFNLLILFIFFSPNPTFAHIADTIKSKTELLIKSPWTYHSALEIKNEAGIWVAKPDTSSECQMDDILIFDIDGTYKIHSGKIKCGIEEELYNSGNWQLSIHGTMLRLDGYTLKISALTENKLQLIRNSGKYEERWTLVRDNK